METVQRFTVSMLIMVIVGIVIISSSFNRLKAGKITRKSFKIQVIETVLLIIGIGAVDLLSFVISFLQNNFTLTMAEMGVIIAYLYIDKKLTGKDSFLG